MRTRSFLLYFTLLLELLVPLSARCADDDPAELAQLRATYLRDVEFAARPIRDRYLSKLEAMKRTLGTKGDVRAAVAVQDEIDKIKDSETGISKFAGAWMIRFDNGTTRRYVITSEGRVNFDEEFGNKIPAKTAKIISKGADFIIEWGDRIERLSLTGKTLNIAHFYPKELYPTQPPNLRATGSLLTPKN